MAVGGKLIKNNKFARFKYNVDKTYEAGIVLTGKDVKAIRANHFEVRDAIIKEEKGELFVWNVIFSDFPEKIQKRKLLLNRAEIDKIATLLKDKKEHAFVLSVRYNERHNIKFDIGVGRVKKVLEKRTSEKRATEKRSFEKEMKEIY